MSREHAARAGSWWREAQGGKECGLHVSAEELKVAAAAELAVAPEEAP
jgi:hypothetical protein